MVPKNPSIQPKIRMPADNVISISDSLRTTEVWKKAVGYDPFNRTPKEPDPKETFARNARASELFAKAKLLGNIPETTPGACPKCGQIGHLAYQCRNYLLPPEQLQSIDIKSKDYSKVNKEDKNYKEKKRHKSKSDDHRKHHRHRDRDRDRHSRTRDSERSRERHRHRD